MLYSIAYKSMLKYISAIFVLVVAIVTSITSSSASANPEADKYQREIQMLQYSGESDRAVVLAKQYVGVAQQKYGNVHKNTASALHIFGVALFTDGQYSEAEKALKQALKIDESLYGPNHPEIVRHLDSLATVYYALVRFEEADRIKARANKINEN